VWTYCTADDGCGGNEAMYSYSQCSLKYQDPDAITLGPAPGDRGPEVTYVSGTLPDKDVDLFVPDTVPVLREEQSAEGCAMCQIEDNANYKAG
jgi:hypothetical protein